MGDSRRLRKKYSTPSHPWQKQRIDDENALQKEYGFKNKQEIWKMASKLRNFKSQVKRLIGKHDEKSEKDKVEFVKRMQKFKYISDSANLEDILAVTLKDICERRLETVVCKKGLARSVKQARQFITHSHVMVGEKKITSPAYLVTATEEAAITFVENSSLKSEDHPERVSIVKQIEEEVKKTVVRKPRAKKADGADKKARPGKK